MLIQIMPVFLIIIAGFLFSLAKIADDRWVSILNKYGLYIGFPTIIFINLTTLSRESLFQQLPTFFTTIGLITLTMVLIMLVTRRLRISVGVSLAVLLGSFNGNIGYLGYPLITAVLPDSGTTIALLISAYIITTYSLGLFIIERMSGRRGSLAATVRTVTTSPFLISAFLGMAFVLLGISVPEPFYGALRMVEGSASPVVLFSLGVFMYRRLDLKAIWKPIFVIFTLKMVLFPLLFLITRRAGNFGPFFDVAILEAMMPIGITNFALSDLYPIDREIIVSAIIITTIAAPIIYPLFTMLI